MPKKRTNEMFIKEVKDIVGTEFTPLSSYEGSNIKVKMFHSNCGNEIEIRPKDFLFKGVRCSICAGNKRLSIEQVKRFVESQSTCKLLSNSYKNSNSILDFECECGAVFKTKFVLFRHHNKRHCDACGKKHRSSKKRLSYDDVRMRIENQGHKLISTEYVNNNIPLSLVCPKGHNYKQTYSDFQGGHMCKFCSNEKNGIRHRKDFDVIKNDINVGGYRLISKVYKNSKEKLSIVCPNNHQFEMNYNDFHYSNHRCPKCRQINIRENATSQIFAYLRTYIGEWKNSSMRECGFKCVLTGGKFDAVHHIYSFNLIAKEAFANLGIEIKPTASDYSDDQLNEIIFEVQRLHTVYGNGVCLRKDVHNLYHSIYGFTNNFDQFEEFKSKWLNGEFKKSDLIFKDN